MNEAEFQNSLEHIQSIITNLEVQRALEVRPEQFMAVRSKIPYRTLLLREAFMHRIIDYSNAALSLAREARYSPAMSCTRTVIETIAYYKLLYDKVIEVVQAKDVLDASEFTEQLAIAMNGINRPITVGKAKAAMNQLIPAFGDIYDKMCDYAHPNLPGLLAAYSIPDKITFVTKLELRLYHEAYGLMISILPSSLELYREHLYNDLAAKLEEYCDICEADPRIDPEL